MLKGMIPFGAGDDGGKQDPFEKVQGARGLAKVIPASCPHPIDPGAQFNDI